MDLAALLRHQDGVVSRHQVLERSLDDSDIARCLRRREWARLFEGVYLDHTGTPTWQQRAWGAVLLHAPAALGGRSALVAAGAATATAGEPISLVVAAHRRIDDPPGVRTSRTRSWEQMVQLHLSPPRVRLEHAALATAALASSDDAAVALLGDLVQQGHTTAPRLVAALGGVRRIPRRGLLEDVLKDVSSGALSALERRYQAQTERAHGLPAGRRQERVILEGKPALRDVLYHRFAVSVELDGRLGHELWRDRWADLDRDLRSVRHGLLTLRAGWGQVLQPCRLTMAVAAVLHARGWDGRPRRCGPDCSIA
jgi:hypothetical protein